MEVQDFTETSTALWLIISDFQKKSPLAIFGNTLSMGCGMSFRRRDKKYISIWVRTAKSSTFTFTVNSASAVRGDAAVKVHEWLDHQT